MNKTRIAAAVLALALLSGCGWDPMSLMNPPPSPTGRPAVSAAPGEEEVLNLPDELYVPCPVYENRLEGFSAKKLTYSFAVTAATDFTITVERKNGTISLGVQDEGGRSYVYDKREFKSESDSVRLEPGTYLLVVSAEHFQGSYGAAGKTAE